MILVTGGSGFIGSNVVEALNKSGEDDILIADELDTSSKWKNLNGKAFADLIDRRELFKRIDDYPIETVVHLGACTDTTEVNASKMIEANYFFSKELWSYCTNKKVKLIYASSAAVYGDGIGGFSEDRNVQAMFPLNLYGFSKLIFDQYAAKQKKTPPFWAGLRFFNVYGPGEAHKGNMASMVYQMYHQILENGMVKLFKSYRNNYPDGGQLRDFIFAEDVAAIICFLLKASNCSSGFYNVGTGESHTFNELAETVFSACHVPVKIEYIEMPKDLRAKYQYYTKSDISKLRSTGCTIKLNNIQEGVKQYLSSV